jgi:hypothetical protein
MEDTLAPWIAVLFAGERGKRAFGPTGQRKQVGRQSGPRESMPAMD